MMGLHHDMTRDAAVVLLNPAPMDVRSSHFVMCDATKTHYIYTKGISDCVGIGLVLRNPQHNVTHIAMYHSYSEHSDELALKIAALKDINILNDMNSISKGAMLVQSLDKFLSQASDNSIVDVIVHLENRNGWNPAKEQESGDKKNIEQIINAILVDRAHNDPVKPMPNIKITYHVQKGGSVFVLFADGTANKLNDDVDRKQFAEKVCHRIEKLICADDNKKNTRAFQVILEDIDQARKTRDYEQACSHILSRVSVRRHKMTEWFFPFIKHHNDEVQVAYDAIRDMLQPYQAQSGLRVIMTSKK